MWKDAGLAPSIRNSCPVKISLRLIPELDILLKMPELLTKQPIDEQKHGYWERSIRDIAYSADKSKYLMS